MLTRLLRARRMHDYYVCKISLLKFEPTAEKYCKIRVILFAAICVENHANDPGVNVLSAT